MNRQTIASLQPQALWQEFAAISDIPRGSRNEAAIIAYIKQRAEDRGLATRSDHVGNLLVMLPGTPGREKHPGLTIQGHVDMVCEKNQGTQHDFEKDPIRLVIDGEWLRADNTTLGADNGIAVAMMMALMAGEHPHGPLDLLFTVDEEIGLVGAMALDASMVRYGTLLNIDGEEDGTFYIGCAGGKETEGHLRLERQATPAGLAACRLQLGGLRGGHSGADIHLQPGNAIKMLARFLRKQLGSGQVHLADFQGGDKHNAIPREAFATLCLSPEALPGLETQVKAWEAQFKAETAKDEPGLFFALQGMAPPPACLSPASAAGLVELVYTLPHGILSMSRTMPGLVSSSTNLAALRCGPEEAFVLTSQRSDIQSLLEDAADLVAAGLESHGASYRFVRDYPAWTPQPDSAILKRVVELYRSEHPDRPVTVGAIHAGLECGVIGSKRPGTDMVSFGPDIQLAHTPRERLHIASAIRQWRFLLTLLAGYQA